MEKVEKNAPVWVADDDKSIRWVLARALKRAGIECRTFERADDVLIALKSEQPLVLVSDIRMPGVNGVELLEKLKADYPTLPVIIMTAFSDLDSAVSAFQRGAFEYMTKPFDIAKAVELISRAMEEGRKNSERVLNEEGPSDTIGLIGQAPAMQELFRAIGRLSQSNVTVLLTGESGAGKEVVARALWRTSRRAKAPYVAINMAAIPRDLLESELFGHEKGAFTGANTLHKGRFEQASGGTLFLDEIGDMPMELQTRLLRVLSNGCFYRVGGREPIRADVRIIAATNQNLELNVREGRFREDLFHRLNVIRLRLPPLRERTEDMAPLVEHFLRKEAAELGLEPKRLTEEAMRVVERFPFPGNVRQLENMCRWILVMAPSTEVRVEDLPEEIRNFQCLTEEDTAKATARNERRVSHAESDVSWETLLARELSDRLDAGENGLWQTMIETFERTVIGQTLKTTNGRRKEAAQRLGLGRNTITRKIQELNLHED